MILEPNRLPGRRNEYERTGGLKLLAADGNIKKFKDDLDIPVSMHRRPAGGRRRNSRPCDSGLRGRISTGGAVTIIELLFCSLLINENADSEGPTLQTAHIVIFRRWSKTPANFYEPISSRFAASQTDLYHEVDFPNAVPISTPPLVPQHSVLPRPCISWVPVYQAWLPVIKRPSCCFCRCSSVNEACQITANGHGK